jgi:ATP-binding protein involved in chromosome partitioning
MPLEKDQLLTALSSLLPPGAISKLNYCDGNASLRIAGKGLGADQRAALTKRLTETIRAAATRAGDTFQDAHIEYTDDAPAPAAPQQGHRPIPVPPAASGSPLLPGVKHIIAVGAGKGGVGKSTIAVNLAIGLARKGHAVGLMDADIYGPSFPTMLGLSGLEVSVRGSTLEPLLVHGVKAMTIGKLVDPEKPLIWRGPMAHGAFKQLVEQTGWGELDYLVIDLPPGTGDVALTMAQTLKLTGAVIVCTPQKVAQDDAVRAARMFQQLNIDVLGVVENMSWFIGDDGKEYDIFGKGGAQIMAQRLGVPFLGAVPINMSLRQNSDSGDPVANFTDTSPRNKPLIEAFERLVTNIENQAALASMRKGHTTPTLSIS